MSIASRSKTFLLLKSWDSTKRVEKKLPSSSMRVFLWCCEYTSSGWVGRSDLSLHVLDHVLIRRSVKSVREVLLVGDNDDSPSTACMVKVTTVTPPPIKVRLNFFQIRARRLASQSLVLRSCNLDRFCGSHKARIKRLPVYALSGSLQCTFTFQELAKLSTGGFLPCQPSGCHSTPHVCLLPTTTSLGASCERDLRHAFSHCILHKHVDEHFVVQRLSCRFLTGWVEKFCASEQLLQSFARPEDLSYDRTWPVSQHVLEPPEPSRWTRCLQPFLLAQCLGVRHAWPRELIQLLCVRQHCSMLGLPPGLLCTFLVCTCWALHVHVSLCSLLWGHEETRPCRQLGQNVLPSEPSSFQHWTTLGSSNMCCWRTSTRRSRKSPLPTALLLRRSPFRFLRFSGSPGAACNHSWRRHISVTLSGMLPGTWREKNRNSLRRKSSISSLVTAPPLVQLGTSSCSSMTRRSSNSRQEYGVWPVLLPGTGTYASMGRRPSHRREERCGRKCLPWRSRLRPGLCALWCWAAWCARCWCSFVWLELYAHFSPSRRANPNGFFFSSLCSLQFVV